MKVSESVVYIVGAGPGDPELMTVKAQRLLRECDAVVYDRLVSSEVLKLVPRGAMLINVGKQPRHHPIPQAEINELLVKLAQARRRVVRLKGGDPFIFGRGSEECEHLARHGIRFEVVPGVTSASGCAASTGIPLTHRGVANSVRFVVGHCREDAELELNWASLADPETTLVVYMGRATIGRIARHLIDAGLSPAMPVAAIADGTTARQRQCIATLGTIAERLAELGAGGPVLFIIGQVVAAAGELGIARGRDAEEHASRA